MACNGMFGTGTPAQPNVYYTLHTARIASINLEARALFYDFWIIGGKTDPSPAEVNGDELAKSAAAQMRLGNFPVTHGSLTKRTLSAMRS